MALVNRARIVGVLVVSLLLLSAPGAVAGSVADFLPDAQVRLGSGSFVGDNIYNTTGLGQAVFNTGVSGQKLTFFIKIQNDGFYPLGDKFKVRRSAGFAEGYRVRYYDAANNDVTGQVTTGSFTTPILQANGIGEYVMRVTVKVRPTLAWLCSFTSRLITVSSYNNPNFKDAVRFTAALGTPDLNCPPVAVNDKASITENSVSVGGNLFANDIDPDGNPFEIVSLNQLPPSYAAAFSFSPSTGSYTWSLNNTGAVDALNNGETLTAVIQYSIQDGDLLTSNIATLTITIHGVTDPD